jgi:hypothetical protein
MNTGKIERGSSSTSAQPQSKSKFAQLRDQLRIISQSKVAGKTTWDAFLAELGKTAFKNWGPLFVVGVLFGVISWLIFKLVKEPAAGQSEQPVRGEASLKILEVNVLGEPSTSTEYSAKENSEYWRQQLESTDVTATEESRWGGGISHLFIENLKKAKELFLIIFRSKPAITYDDFKKHSRYTEFLGLKNSKVTVERLEKALAETINTKD